VETLTKQMAILNDIHQATRHGLEPDAKLLAEKHCSTAKDSRKAFNLVLVKLRAAGLIQRKEPGLTVLGVQKLKEAGLEAVRYTDDSNGF
jgi:hypothetical protein